MNVALIGAGNMGISWAGAALLNGHNVTVIDKDSDKLEALQSGQLTVGEEPLWSCIRLNELQVSTNLASVRNAKIIFIAVQTPSRRRPEDDWNTCDYSALVRVLDELTPHLSAGQVVILGSTVFPGAIAEHISPRLKNAPVWFAYQPVFLRAGGGVHDYLHPSKIVVGVQGPACAPPVLDEFLKSTTWNTAKINYCTYQEAEFAKLLHNTFMCLKLNFANEVGDLCTHYGVDAARAIELTFDETPEGRLLTRSHMLPGPPFSGTCLPKDSAILNGILESQGLADSCPTLATAHSVNDDRVRDIIYNLNQVSSIGIIGMAYRPGYNDIRQSLAVRLADVATEMYAGTGTDVQLHFWDSVFSDMTEEDYMLAARRDPKVEALWPNVTRSIDNLLIMSEAIIVNCRLDDDLRQLLESQTDKRIIDLYGNEAWDNE